MAYCIRGPVCGQEADDEIMVEKKKDETETAAASEATVEQPDAATAAGEETHVAPDEAPEPSEIERLTGELTAARAEAQRLEDQFLRQAAETENYRKRVAREKQDAIRYANESLVRDLLPVIDDLERAVEHGLTDDNGQSLLDGVALVHRSCLEALQKHGVTQVTAKGEPFDPEKHEAFAQVETAEHDANTVVDEVHRGYYLNDRLLRPSLVSVAKTPAKQVENTVENDPTDD